jgi:hypothetical protein
MVLQGRIILVVNSLPNKNHKSIEEKTLWLLKTQDSALEKSYKLVWQDNANLYDALHNLYVFKHTK